MNLPFLPFCKIIISVISFLGQDIIKLGSNFEMIAYDLSQKHKLAPFQSSGGSETNKL